MSRWLCGQTPSPMHQKARNLSPIVPSVILIVYESLSKHPQYKPGEYSDVLNVSVFGCWKYKLVA